MRTEKEFWRRELERRIPGGGNKTEVLRQRIEDGEILGGENGKSTEYLGRDH